MANNVNTAFDEFLSTVVNIESSENQTAKRSKNWLFNQIQTLSTNNFFLRTVSQYNIGFGSYSRKTKIRPLDDIDIIIGLNGSKMTYYKANWDDISLSLNSDNNDPILKSLSDKVSQSFQSEVYYLNSNRVKNKLVSALKSVPQYVNADIHARGEAVTLKLSSYDWTFDIVPAFYVDGDSTSNPYYLIPNGSGKWKMTNPKLEQQRVSNANQRFNGVVLSVIRLVKYWNKRGKMPNITSYVLETLVLDYFDQAEHNKFQSGNTYDWVDIHFRNVLDYIDRHIWLSVQDTKGIQGDVNNLSWEQKNKIQIRSRSDYSKACSAVYAEITDKDQKKSINIWRDIFGSEFPTYG